VSGKRLQRKRSKFLGSLGQKARILAFSVIMPLAAGLSSCSSDPATTPQTCKDWKTGNVMFLPNCESGAKVIRTDTLPSFVHKQRIYFTEQDKETCENDLLSTTFSGMDKRLHFSDQSAASGRDFSGSKIILNSTKENSLENGECKISKEMSTMKIADVSTNELHDTGIINFGYAFFWGEKVVYAKLKEVEGKKLSDIYMYDPKTNKSQLLVEQGFLPGDKPITGDKLVYASFIDGLLRIRDLISEDEVILDNEKFSGDPYTLQVHANKYIAIVNTPAIIWDPFTIYTLDGQVKKTVPKKDLGLGFPFRSLTLHEDMLIYVKNHYLMFSLPVALDLESGMETPVMDPQDMFEVNCKELPFYGPIFIFGTRFFIEGKKLNVFSVAEFCKTDKPPSIYYYGIQEFDLDKIKERLK
jgi:hypothetical protein